MEYMETDDIDEEEIEDGGEVDGSILSVHVKNFFCHENLEIKFNKNINFIVGRNGSGKSAILTALVVGLGGRASATNRGSNLHSFIRKGANSATVEIKIKNNSAKAYKPNVYGDIITVVRHIQASGGSNYKVKSANGEVVSTKFEEVNAITLAHDIQVDNPISVLNQDDARSFHASDAKKKYALFRKATNLDQTEHNYMRAMENCKKALAVWTRKHEASLELEKEFKKWESSYEQLQSRDQIESLKEELQNEYYWSEISEMEADLKNVQVQYDRQKIKIQRLVEKLASMEESFGVNNDTITALKNKLEQKSNQKETLQEELRKFEHLVRGVQDNLRKSQQSSSKQNDILAREKRKLDDLDKEISSIGSGSASNRRAALERQTQSLQSSVESSKARASTASHEAEQARLHSAKVMSDLEIEQSNAKRHTDKIRQIKQQLRELESRGNDSLAVYGNDMVELCNKIKQAVAKGVFSAPPKGPVGSFIKVKEKKWGGALEHIIGGSVKSFCVNTPEDSRKLFDIMGKVYGSSPKPSVTCSKFLNKVHNVSKNKVSARGFLSALDSIDVSDPVVANYLIDNLSLEKILLVAEHDDAIRLSDNVENVPENCSKIVTLDSTEFHPAPNYRSYGGMGRGSRYLTTSSAERKRQLLKELQQAEETQNALEENVNDLQAQMTQAKQMSKHAEHTLRQMLAEKLKHEEALREHSMALEHARAPQQDVLIEEQQVSLRKVESLSQQLEELSSKEKEFRKQIDAYEEQMKKTKVAIGQLTTACRSLNEELEQEQLKCDRGVTERQVCSQKIKEDEMRFAQVEKILKEKKKELRDKEAQAMQLCDRIVNPREKSVVCAELKKTQLQLSSIRVEGLSKAEVGEKLLQVEQKYRRTKNMLDRLKVLIAEIQKTADKHLNFCHKVQTYIARRVQHCFQSILTLRGYSGRMDMDNGRGLLEIFCTGRETAAKRSASSTSSLSGGERSYSTVAFIMSLWDCVELPFYFMDEFDVFMDNVNRKIVMELLIDHAAKNTNKQFVFLTPQDTSSVSAGPLIKIHRMADPRR